MMRLAKLLLVAAALPVMFCGDDPSGPDENLYDRDIAAIQAILDANNLGGGLVLPREVAQCSTNTGVYRAEKLWLYGTYLHGHTIDTIPPEIGQLTALTYLRFDGNQVHSLPSTIGNLKSLVTIIGSNNALSALPAGIYQLPALRTLTLSTNQLASLSEEVGQLSRLVSLNVSSNLLTTLPSALMNLDSLTNLDFSDNAVCTLSVDMVNWLSAFGYGANWKTQTLQRCP